MGTGLDTERALPEIGLGLGQAARRAAAADPAPRRRRGHSLNIAVFVPSRAPGSATTVNPGLRRSALSAYRLSPNPPAARRVRRVPPPAPSPVRRRRSLLAPGFVHTHATPQILQHLHLEVLSQLLIDVRVLPRLGDSPRSRSRSPLTHLMQPGQPSTRFTAPDDRSHCACSRASPDRARRCQTGPVPHVLSFRRST
jgi:hypothetical protein